VSPVCRLFIARVPTITEVWNEAGGPENELRGPRISRQFPHLQNYTLTTDIGTVTL